MGERVPLDGFEEFLQFCADGQVCISGGFVGSLDSDLFGGVEVGGVVLADNWF